MSGYLTTHVLDTAKGCPAEGVNIDLFRLGGDQRMHLQSMYTNPDGRTDTPILPAEKFQTGVYELVFHVGDYIIHLTDANRTELFLDLVPIRFNMAKQAHYHVPLLLSPFGYSTYRGS
jgi:5-hydroxyisourate hydrolase